MAKRRFEMWGVEPDGSDIDWRPWFQIRSPSQVARKFTSFGDEGEKLCVADRDNLTITTFTKLGGRWVNPKVSRIGEYANERQ